MIRCSCNAPKFAVGDRVWSARDKQYGTITGCHLPPPCGPDCINTPCNRCGGDGVDVIDTRARCSRCAGKGAEPKDP